MAIEAKHVDLTAVVGLVATDASEASEAIVEGTRAHGDGRVPLGSKFAVEVNEGFHSARPCV
jgi:hypothetical protein